MTYPPRILRVVYRSAHHPRRLARVNAKVPYSGIYAMSEVLARALSQNEILWYRIERIAPSESHDQKGVEAVARRARSVKRTNVRTMGNVKIYAWVGPNLAWDYNKYVLDVGGAYIQVRVTGECTAVVEPFVVTAVWEEIK